jgi:thymidylate synthase
MVNRVKDIRELLIKEYLDKNFIIDKTGVKTIEIIAAHFLSDEEYIFGLLNQDYINREIKWYISQSLNVNDIEVPPKLWKKVADKDGFINSNYGWVIWSKENCSQYDNCLKELQLNKDSRRATMIYNRPSMWEDYKENGRNDFMCTYATQYFIRNNKLITYVLMRPNDCFCGYRNDRFWQMYVSEKLSKDLNIEMGDMYWTSGSLHLYESQFHLIEEYLNKI